MPITIDTLRRFTVARNFPRLSSLQRVLDRMGFVQADPIRSPARAQDLILRQRVKDYVAGDLERLYQKLDVEEDFFINYGFVTRTLQSLMHPRSEAPIPEQGIVAAWGLAKAERVQHLFDFVKTRGIVHPREVDAHFSHGKVTNYWGGASNATTHLLDAMHYGGLLRVVRREKGIRLYAACDQGSWITDDEECRRRIDAMVDVVVRIYAPLPGTSLSLLVRRLRYAAPRWKGDLSDALTRAKDRFSQIRIEGRDWFWPEGESPARKTVEDRVRILAPFDPLVHDRARFELLWGWAYRFEAYTPARQRKLGYYAMPLLWRDRVIGWANVSVSNGDLCCDFGYVTSSAPKDRVFKRELDAEIERLRTFLTILRHP